MEHSYRAGVYEQKLGLLWRECMRESDTYLVQLCRLVRLGRKFPPLRIWVLILYSEPRTGTPPPVRATGIGRCISLRHRTLAAAGALRSGILEAKTLAMP